MLLWCPAVTIPKWLPEAGLGLFQENLPPVPESKSNLFKHTHIHTNTHTYMSACMYTCAHMHKHTHKHARAYITHAHIHIHKNTKHTKGEVGRKHFNLFCCCCQVWSLVFCLFFRCSGKDKLAIEPLHRTYTLCPCSEQEVVRVCCHPVPRHTTKYKKIQS